MHKRHHPLLYDQIDSTDQSKCIVDIQIKDSHAPSFFESDHPLTQSYPQVPTNEGLTQPLKAGDEGGLQQTKNPQRLSQFALPNISSAGSRINTERGDEEEMMDLEFFKHDESEIAAAMIGEVTSGNVKEQIKT